MWCFDLLCYFTTFAHIVSFSVYCFFPATFIVPVKDCSV